MEMILDCPYCRTIRVGFSYVAHSERPTQTQMVGVGAFSYSVPLVDTLMRCRQCERCVVVVLVGPQGSIFSPSQTTSDLSTISGHPEQSGFSVESVLPKLSTIAAPEHCPDEIASDYKEALQNLRQNRAQSAGMMFRRVLEKSVQEIAAKRNLSLKGSWLSGWLKQLKGSEPLSEGMHTLATQIRMDGNEATHDDKPFDLKSARQLRLFTELFLTYVYTLPIKVAQAKQQQEAPTQPVSEEVSPMRLTNDQYKTKG